MGMLDRLFHAKPIRKYPEMPQIATGLTQSAICNMRKGIFVPIPVTKLVLAGGESCFYCDHAVVISEKMQVVGRKRKGGGFSVRVLRGLTYHTGDDGNDVIRDWVPEYTKGKLYITNQRIVFSADAQSFNKPLDSIVSFGEECGNLIIQFDKISRKFYLPTTHCAIKAIEYSI